MKQGVRDDSLEGCEAAAEATESIPVSVSLPRGYWAGRQAAGFEEWRSDLVVVAVGRKGGPDPHRAKEIAHGFAMGTF